YGEAGNHFECSDFYRDCIVKCLFMTTTDTERYRRYDQLRRIGITINTADQWARTDAVARYLYLRAKSSLMSVYDEWEAPVQESRRLQIYKAFKAEDYRNPTTRQ